MDRATDEHSQQERKPATSCLARLSGLGQLVGGIDLRLCGGDCADGVSHGHHAGHGQQRVIVSGDLVRLEMRERRLMGHVDVLPDAVPEVPAERGLWIVGDGLPGDGVGAVVQVDDAAQGREANVQSAVLRGVLGCDGGFPAHGHRQSAVIVGGQIAVGSAVGEPLFGLLHGADCGDGQQLLVDFGVGRVV